MNEPHLDQSLGLFETVGLTPALVALDAMEKCANVRVHQAEINDFLGVVIKIGGPLADVRVALEAGENAAKQMRAEPITHVIASPAKSAEAAILSPREFNPLIQQDVVTFPDLSLNQQESTMSRDASYALGFIETQGFTAVFEAVDSACKAANVEVVGKEKLGGGYVTVVVRGDVAAVKAAIDAARTRVDGLGNLIAAHVIPNPSPSVLGILP